MKVLRPVGGLIGTVSNVVGESSNVILKVSTTIGTAADATKTAVESIDNVFKAGEQMSMCILEDALADREDHIVESNLRATERISTMVAAYRDAGYTKEEIKKEVDAYKARRAIRLAR